MMKIKKFDSNNIDVVAAALEAAVRDTAKKLGLDIKGHGCTWGPSETTFRLRASVPGAAEREAKAEYKQHAKSLGLPADGIGKVFVYGKHSFTITGLDIGKRYPVKAVRDDGGWWGFAESLVIDALKNNPASAK